MKADEIKEAEKRALGRVGRLKPKFRYRGHAIPELKGTLKDRVAMHTRSITEMKDFFDVIDLIEFDVEGVKKEAIRFGYYIYEDGKLRWGSQTTLTEEKSILLDLFRKAYEKPWFRELIDECSTHETQKGLMRPLEYRDEAGY